MKILIVGAGISGLTLGAFLEDSSVEFEIIEKASDWNHQGFLIGIWENGRAILEKLGLAPIFDASGSAVQKYSIRNGKGSLLRNYDLSSFYVNYGGAVRLIERADLHTWLFGKISSQKIQMGVTIDTISQTSEKVQIKFNNGRTGEYDLIVGADGVHSSVRNLVFGQQQFESYDNWRVWCVWIDKKFDTVGTITEYVEPRELSVVFSAGEKAMAWLVAPENHASWDTEQGRADRLKQIFKDETMLMPKLLEKINDSQILPTDLLDIRLKTWTMGRVTLAGDAAHSFGPHAGMGGSMAMEDGYILAGELMQVSENYSLSQALKQYEQKRKKRIKITTNLSHRLRRYTLIKSKILRKTIDFFIPFVPARFLTSDYDLLLKEKL